MCLFSRVLFALAGKVGLIVGRFMKRTGFCSYSFLRGLGICLRGILRSLRDRAVRLLSDRLADDGSCSQWRAVNEIAPKLGVANESLRRWYEQHLVNTGERQGMTREEHEEVKRLKREVAELRRANEILKTASAFFAAELDRPAR